MTTYINSKKPEKICNHAHTIKKNGWETCVDCRSRLSRIFHDDPYSDRERCLIKPKKDRFIKINQIMTDVINSVTKKKDTLNGMLCWDGPLKGGLPFELFDHLKELCLKCMDLEKNTKCHRRSLCAAILWEKVKSLYPTSMTLTEFSKRVGVSVPTIIKTCKKLKRYISTI